MPHYDLVIIGSGSGNSLVTPDFADKSVAVVERGIFGGTCLNVGCIPTKMFVYAAEVADVIRGANRYGVQAHLDGVDWPAIRDRIFGRIDPISAGGREYRRTGSSNTTLYEASARFTGPRTLAVGDDELTADQIVIATGSHAHVPREIADSGVPFHTSDTVMRIDRLPASMIIVGGGYIAAEFAHVFGALGTRVTLLVRGERMLTAQDELVSQRFTELAAGHWDLRTQVTATSYEQVDGGVRAHLSDGTTADAELLLVATGRVPSTADLDLAAAGVDTHDDGRVVVDAYGRTGAEGVWALGDVSSPYQLKHVANAEARAVAHNLAHPDDLRAMPHDHVPAAVFTHPQIASVGLTEQQARDAGHEVTCKVQAYGDTAYGWAMEDSTSFAKLVADARTGRLLGAHLMGPEASTLIQPLVQAMAFDQPAQDVARGQYWIHPALTEVVENALLGLETKQ